MSEAALESYFRIAVSKLLRGHTFKMIPVEAGIPDRVVLLPGGSVRFVELKVRGGRTSPLQKVWHARLQRLGFEAAVLTGTQDVDAWVVEVRRKLYT